MNALTKWNPFSMARWNPMKELEEMENRMERLVGRSPLLSIGEPITTAVWEPLVDITEDNKEYLVKAELPEVNKEDVKVSVEDSSLVISGERKKEKEEKGRRYHRMERSYGAFVRTFSLPPGADAGKVKAEFKDGLLTVHLPKTEQAIAKSHEIKVE
ncbi:MAG: Hsp20/alpha crystallin family protein [Verrucomicrobiota bacterium]